MRHRNKKLKKKLGSDREKMEAGEGRISWFLKKTAKQLDKGKAVFFTPGCVLGWAKVEKRF